VGLIDGTLTALGPELVLAFSRLDVYRVLLRSLLRIELSPSHQLVQAK